MTTNIPNDRYRSSNTGKNIEPPNNFFARYADKLHALLEWIFDQWNTSALKQGLSKLWDKITDRLSKKEPSNPSKAETEASSTSNNKETETQPVSNNKETEIPPASNNKETETPPDANNKSTETPHNANNKAPETPPNANNKETPPRPAPRKKNTRPTPAPRNIATRPRPAPANKDTTRQSSETSEDPLQPTTQSKPQTEKSAHQLEKEKEERKARNIAILSEERDQKDTLLRPMIECAKLAKGTPSDILKWNPFNYYLESAAHETWITTDRPTRSTPFDFQDPNLLSPQILDLEQVAIQNLAQIIDRAEQELGSFTTEAEKQQLNQLFEQLKTSSPLVELQARNPNNPLSHYKWKELDALLKCTNALAVQAINSDPNEGLLFCKIHASVVILSSLIREAKAHAVYNETIKDRLQDLAAINTSASTTSNDPCISFIQNEQLESITQQLDFLSIAKSLTSLFIDSFSNNMDSLVAVEADNPAQLDNVLFSKVDTTFSRPVPSYGINPFYQIGSGDMRVLIRMLKEHDSYKASAERLETHEELSCLSYIISRSAKDSDRLTHTQNAIHKLINKIHQHSAPNTTISIEDVQNHIVSYFDKLLASQTQKLQAQEEEGSQTALQDLHKSSPAVREQVIQYTRSEECISMITNSPFVQKQSSET